MKKIKNLATKAMALICVCLCGVLLTNCNDDLQRTRALFGEWRGYWGMYYEYEYRGRVYVFDSYNTDLVFYPNSQYATYGDGYQVDWYLKGPYSRISLHFLWEVRNGRIYLTYPGNHMYDTDIYDYFLNDFEFYGYFGNSNERFDMVKLAQYNWAPYFGHEYYYWTYDDWSWNEYNGYYYTRSTKKGNLADKARQDTIGTSAEVASSEDTTTEGRIIKIGCRKADEKTTEGR